jgi:hypothetical protein
MLPERVILLMVKIQFVDIATKIVPTTDFLFSTAKIYRNLTFTLNIHFSSLPLKSENMGLAQFSKEVSVIGKQTEVNPYIKK